MSVKIARILRKNMTDAEALLWKHLRQRPEGFKFRRQHPVGEYIVDFACPGKKLAIEVDGGQHAIQTEEDNARTDYLEKRGYRLVRFWNNDVLNNIEGVLEVISQYLENKDASSPQPSPPEGVRKYSLQEIVKLLEERGLPGLFEEASRIRKKCVGDEVYLRGIIEFSNYCVQDCMYCGLRSSNANLARYRMSDDEIVEGAKTILAANIGTIVLQSGEDAYYSAERIASIIRRIKAETGLVITLSLGEWPPEAFETFRDAGADRYLLKHETSDPTLYSRIRPDCDQAYRIKCLKRLKSLKFETGSGMMIGLPGQTLESIAEDIMMFRDLDIDMIGIGPFIPHPDTPLAGNPAGNVDLVLKAVAATRIVTRNTNIPATTALTTIDARNRVRSLMAGANVIMPDFTPVKYRRLYEIYPGKGSSPAEPSEIIEGIRKDVEAAGRKIGKGPGNRLVHNYMK